MPCADGDISHPARTASQDAGDATSPFAVPRRCLTQGEPSAVDRPEERSGGCYVECSLGAVEGPIDIAGVLTLLLVCVSGCRRRGRPQNHLASR